MCMQNNAKLVMHTMCKTCATCMQNICNETSPTDHHHNLMIVQFLKNVQSRNFCTTTSFLVTIVFNQRMHS